MGRSGAGLPPVCGRRSATQPVARHDPRRLCGRRATKRPHGRDWRGGRDGVSRLGCLPGGPAWTSRPLRLPSNSGPRSPGTGTSRARHPAGDAGLPGLRQGWQPGRGETQAAGRGLDAQRNSPTEQSEGTSGVKGACQLCSVRSRWRRSGELTLTNIKPTFASVAGATMYVGERLDSGRSRYRASVSRRERPFPARAADSSRPSAALRASTKLPAGSANVLRVAHPHSGRSRTSTVGPSSACQRLAAHQPKCAIA